MKNIIDYLHTIPGITAHQVNTVVSMMEALVDKRKVKKAARKEK
jgi:hypothetical protein